MTSTKNKIKIKPFRTKKRKEIPPWHPCSALETFAASAKTSPVDVDRGVPKKKLKKSVPYDIYCMKSPCVCVFVEGTFLRLCLSYVDKNGLGGG